MPTPFHPEHMNATPEDLEGNNGIGRYILLPGSDGRAREIATHFDNVVVKSHPRSHHLYLGTLTSQGKTIDVATISSGMGCPSMEIIVHELFYLGARRFLRVGTAGSLQPYVHVGDLVNVSASVRDERTTTYYAPVEVPAVATQNMVSIIQQTAERLRMLKHVHTGVAHCKDSLYAREFGAGPRSEENQAYIRLLSENGVLASEMETATLFIQTQIYQHQLLLAGKTPAHQVLAGAILAIVSTQPHTYEHISQADTAIAESILLALESVKTLAIRESIG